MSNQRKIKELVEFVQTIDKLNWLLISENDKNNPHNGISPHLFTKIPPSFSINSYHRLNNIDFIK